MPSDRLPLHRFLTGGCGHSNLCQNGKIVKFAIQIAFATASSRNRHKVRIQFESTHFIRLINHVINRQGRTPECPFEVGGSFILGNLYSVIFIIDQLSAALYQQSHIISDFFPLVALFAGILNFVCLGEDIFKSLPCDIDFCRSIQRQIGDVKENMALFHLFDQIIQQGFGDIHTVRWQRRTSAEQSVLFHKRFCA